MKFDPRFAKLLDECINGVTEQTINALKHGNIAPNMLPLASMTVFLGAYNKIALGAPPEGRQMVLELLSENLRMIEKAWGTPIEKKEESRIILPFK